MKPRPYVWIAEVWWEEYGQWFPTSMVGRTKKEVEIGISDFFHPRHEKTRVVRYVPESK